MNPLVLYDGNCGLCHTAVRAILRADETGLFRFAPLQGETAQRVMTRHFQPRALPDSLVLVMNMDGVDESLLVRTDAVIAISGILDGVWRCGRLLKLIPRPVRDMGYDWIARFRNRIVPGPGCPIADGWPRYRTRFLP